MADFPRINSWRSLPFVFLNHFLINYRTDYREQKKVTRNGTEKSTQKP